MSVREIGKLVKVEHSQWDDIPDGELGEIVLDHIEKDPSYLETILKIQSVYSPTKGRLTSKWQIGKTEARLKLIGALIAERRAVFDLMSHMFDLEELLNRQELARIRMVYERQQLQAGHELAMEITDTLKMRETLVQAELTAATHLTKVAADSGMSLRDYLEWTKKKAMDQADIEADMQTAMVELQYVQLSKHMPDYTRLEVINESLLRTYRRIYQIANDPNEPVEVKLKMIETLTRDAETYEQDKKATRKRLRESGHGKDKKGTRKKTEPPATPRPPLGRDRK